VLFALVVVTQWNRLRDLWDDWWYALRDRPAAAVSGNTEYFCPMDPGVISAWPAICPICNMDLVQRRKHDAQILPEGVVARMQLTPYRIQLAGIRTSEVAPRRLWHEIHAAGILAAGDAADGSASDADASGNGLMFSAAISSEDAPLMQQPRDATVSLTSDSTVSCVAVAELIAAKVQRSPDGAVETAQPTVPLVRVTLRGTGADRFTAGAGVRTVIRVPGAESLAVPESAVVDHGSRRLVFVESMPGTFDAVVVELGRRSGDYYPVIKGLKAGERVAATGAFLIDAETRLNPSLAITYFGANQSAADRRLPEVRVAEGGGNRSAAAAAVKLTPQELQLVKRQRICPVTNLPLDSMGGPVPLVVQGRKVYMCCKGCEAKLKADPAKYLSRLPAND
jgi:hypothetical protein